MPQARLAFPVPLLVVSLLSSSRFVGTLGSQEVLQQELKTRLFRHRTDRQTNGTDNLGARRGTQIPGFIAYRTNLASVVPKRETGSIETGSFPSLRTLESGEDGLQGYNKLVTLSLFKSPC